MSETPKGKFANIGSASALAPRCVQCDKIVYKMEEVVALGRIWHKSCFTCGGTEQGTECCKRTLTLDKYTAHGQDPYCDPCYARNFRKPSIAPATPEEYKPRSNSSATPVAAKFANIGAANAMAPKCNMCTKIVYKMEEVYALGKYYHKSCFRCGGTETDGCKKGLSLDTYTEHDCQPYCNTCYTKNFGPKGYGFGASLETSLAAESGSRKIDIPDGDEEVKGEGSTPTYESVANRKASFTPPMTKSSPLMQTKSSAQVAAKFANIGAGNAMAPKCTVCTKTVYKMEEIVALGKTYHKSCFRCGGTETDGCSRTLTLDKYTEHDSHPYCGPCYSKNFGPKGYGYGNNLLQTGLSAEVN